MRKFANLLKKEIRELINKQLVISLVFMVALFSMMGGLAKTEAKKAAAKANKPLSAKQAGKIAPRAKAKPSAQVQA